MQKTETSPRLFERYLALLGLSRSAPSVDSLRDVVSAHMTRVPFENISKLYYKKRYGLRQLPDPNQYLDGIDKFNFGGTCYSNNHFLNQLLVYLGFDAMLCGADIGSPDGHLVNMVTVDSREFLVDAGYAAPFIEPLPRDADQDIEIALGRDRYVLRPADERGNSRVDLYRDGELIHGYTAKPIPRTIDFFNSHIERSFAPQATFMNALLAVRFSRNRSTVIYNLTVIQSEGTDYEIQRLTSRDQIPEVVERYMSIPREIAAEAISVLGELGNPWS